MAKYTYPALFVKEGDNYAVSFPDIPGCITAGTSISEALKAALFLFLLLFDSEDFMGKCHLLLQNKGRP